MRRQVRLGVRRRLQRAVNVKYDGLGTPSHGGHTPRLGPGKAVDRPVFWWVASGVFLANAALSASEERWLVAFLQVVTAVWALVAGLTARQA